VTEKEKEPKSSVDFVSTNLRKGKLCQSSVRMDLAGRGDALVCPGARFGFRYLTVPRIVSPLAVGGTPMNAAKTIKVMKIG
jgi:hypothetical protein